MPQMQTYSDGGAAEPPASAKSGDAILELLHHVRGMAEDDGDAEMAAVVESALKRCAAIHVRRRRGHELSSLSGSADQ